MSEVRKQVFKYYEAYMEWIIGLSVHQRDQKMMKNMGWKHGDGLGKTKEGIKEPIQPELQVGRRGLGYSPMDKDDNLALWTRYQFS